MALLAFSDQAGGHGCSWHPPPAPLSLPVTLLLRLLLLRFGRVLRMYF
jgi:hypothetical protein